MEKSEPMTVVAVAPDRIVELARRPGPFVEVDLTTDAEIDNAKQRSEQGWKPLRGELVERGAPEKLLAAIDPLVGDAPLRGQCLTVVADAHGHRHVEHQPDPPTRDVARWGPIPVFGPLL